MTIQNKSRYTTAIVAILCGTTASADVTAQQVWDNWTEQAQIYGQGFSTGDESMSGDTLTIADVRIEMADDDASILANLGDLMLTENGDGTVSITMAGEYPITIATTPEYSDPSTINVTVRQSAMSLLVSGEPDAMVYDISADSYAISVDSLEGDIATEVDLQDAMIALLDLSGQYSVSEDNLTRVLYKMNVGAVDIDVLFREIGGDGIVKANGDIADLQASAQIALPIGIDFDSPEPPFKEGLAMVAGYSFGNVAYAFDFNADGEAAKGDATVDGGELAVSFDIDGLSYIGQSNNIDISLLLPNEIPFPLEATLAQYGFDFQIPLSQGEGGPRDARMAFNITDLSISDTLWNLVDPASVLPRDPLTVAAGFDAQVTPFFDFLDPDQQQAAAMSDIPGEINGLELTELTVRGAGAEITGEGAFTFDNNDLATFDGLPRPEGTATFAINGVNGLVDKLIQMGLIPQEEAMMPRMMLGMFATPVGDDMLTSTIEVNSEGHVLANGQRLR